MQLIMEEISKPAFWVFGVFLAIVVNLISSYLKRPMDGFLSIVSVKWQNASNSRRRRWHARIERIAGCQMEWDNERQTEIRRRLQCILYFLLSFMLMHLFSDPIVTESKTTIILINAMGGLIGAFIGALWFAASDNRQALEDVIRFRRGMPLSIKPPEREAR